MSPTREIPRVLAELGQLLDRAGEHQGGALWRLAEPGRQLDANLVRLAPGAEVGAHAEPDLDVLLVVVEGSGELGVGHPGGGTDREPLTARAVVWLPRLSRRSLHAGPDGLVYLTVHRRRAGLSIKGPGSQGLSSQGLGSRGLGSRGLGSSNALRGEAGGDAPCLLDRVCPACDRVSPEATARFCGQCGAELPPRAS